MLQLTSRHSRISKQWVERHQTEYEILQLNVSSKYFSMFFPDIACTCHFPITVAAPFTFPIFDIPAAQNVADISDCQISRMVYAHCYNRRKCVVRGWVYAAVTRALNVKLLQKWKMLAVIYDSCYDNYTQHLKGECTYLQPNRITYISLWYGNALHRLLPVLFIDINSCWDD